jgi:hypothetical protein
MPDATGKNAMDRLAGFKVRWIIGLTLFGVALRAVFLFLAGDLEPYADESHYLYLSLVWHRFSFYSDSSIFFWPPGYPFMLATSLGFFGTGGIFAVKLCQVLASAVIGSMLMLITGRLFPWRTVVVTGFIWSVYLPLIGFTHYLWPETFYLSLFLTGFYLLLRWWQETPRASARNSLLVAAGLLMGTSLLFKEIGFWWCLLVCVLVVFHDRRIGWRTALSRAALYGFSIGVIVLPWALRNHEVYGRVVPVGATLGQNFFLGVNSRYINYDCPPPLQRQLGQANITIRRALLKPTPPAWNRSDALNIINQSSENVERGVRFALEHPGFALRTRIKKLADWVTPASFFLRSYGLGVYHGSLGDPLMRKLLIAVALILPLLVLAASVGGMGYGLHGAPGRGLVLWTLVYFALTSSLIVSMSRYRINIEPLLIMLCAAFLTGAGRPWRPRKAAVFCLIGWVVLAALWIVNAAEVRELVKNIW